MGINGTEPAPTDLSKIWKEWDLRAMVLFTLGVQMILLLLGNRRKSSHEVWLRVLVLSAYLTSDFVVVLTLGVLSSKLMKVKEIYGQLDNNGRLVALWAPMLLLLLGGPDTITAYSLEDNALWLRHLLTLFVQAVATTYVQFMACRWTIYGAGVRIEIFDLLPSFLSLAMILVGLIRYGGRTRVLWWASKDKLRESMLAPPDPCPNYPRFMDEYSLKQAKGYHLTADEVIEVHIPTSPYARGYLSNIIDFQDIQCENTIPLPVEAYGLLQILKHLFVDLIHNNDDCARASTNT